MGKLNDIIGEYAEKNPVRFHMPGHKGRSADNLNYSRDVTELFFTDNLFNPDRETDLIYGLENRISKCFFKRQDVCSLISCSGATLCIQGALLSLIRLKQIKKECERLYIICDRASHISFVNAISLLDIIPLWVYPGENFEEKINYFAQTQNTQNIAGVFVTSPDYFGNMKNIEGIADECRKYSLNLAVDNSHGSHLAFHKRGLLHPINLGAAISIDSVHKTLPALTGAALLHADKKLFDGGGKEVVLRNAMKVFASTSPSYPVLQSMESMIDLLEERGFEEHERLLNDIDLFRQKAARQGFLSDSPETRAVSDPYRIVLSCSGSGENLYYFLAEKNIVCEFFDNDSVIIIPSIANRADDFERLFGALGDFVNVNGIVPGISKKYGVPEITTSNSAITLNSALKMPRETVETGKAAGRISAESVYSYPPGIPLILPGEIIDGEIYVIIKNMRDTIEVISLE